MANMANTEFDVAGIGNAIVDVLSPAEDGFLSSQELPKGGMTLIDSARAEGLYADMGPGREVSGGSAANTLAGLASLGGKAAFIGKVRDDQLGGIFRHDIGAAGVSFKTPPATGGAPTARCLIFVTPDAQRTMCTYLGACVELGPVDIDEATVGGAKVTYLEGYLWDPPRAKEAFVKAAKVAHDAGREVALSLSDPFCVERHREEFRDLVEGHVDLLFANESEIRSLYETDTFDEALRAVRGSCAMAALTRGDKGSVVLEKGTAHAVDVEPVDRLVDTTGAGDLYAAGFLYGYTRGRPAHDCSRMGAIAAAEAISHFGARPEVSLSRLLKETLG